MRDEGLCINVQQEEQRFQATGKERESKIGKTVGVHAVGERGGGGLKERKKEQTIKNTEQTAR